MTDYHIDDEILEAAEASGPQLAETPTYAPGDWRSMRKRINDDYEAFALLAPPVPLDVDRQIVAIPANDGSELQCRWYSRGDDRSGAAVIYAHGGGMVGGEPDHYERMVSTYVSASGVPFLSVGYRLSPGARGSQPTEDVLSGLSWLLRNAEEQSVEPQRIALMGDSAGGGIAASAAILARDRGIVIERQILIYPMLDDRVDSASPALRPFLTWTPEMNAIGWGARVDDAPSEATSPARLEDFSHLAPAYLEVGDLDLFRDETLHYAQRLSGADVPIELHVHPSAPHGYDLIAPRSRVTLRAMQDRIRVLKEL
jgi:acetyl esterase/lipase